jgi:hypothetical protein
MSTPGQILPRHFTERVAALPHKQPRLSPTRAAAKGQFQTQAPIGVENDLTPEV